MAATMDDLVVVLERIASAMEILMTTFDPELQRAQSKLIDAQMVQQVMNLKGVDEQGALTIISGWKKAP
jgi:predicted DNA-binding protein (UPF0251 family)